MAKKVNYIPGASSASTTRETSVLAGPSWREDSAESPRGRSLGGKITEDNILCLGLKCSPRIIAYFFLSLPEVLTTEKLDYRWGVTETAFTMAIYKVRWEYKIGEGESEREGGEGEGSTPWKGERRH